MKKRQKPILRGIGCVLVVVLGLVAYLFSGWFLVANAENTWIYLPPEIILPPQQLPWLPPGAIVRLVIALTFMVASYGLLSLVYAIAFPVKPGETDAPRPPRPPKKKKRR